VLLLFKLAKHPAQIRYETLWMRSYNPSESSGKLYEHRLQKQEQKKAGSKYGVKAENALDVCGKCSLVSTEKKQQRHRSFRY
jgi:hypothetical protein